MRVRGLLSPALVVLGLALTACGSSEGAPEDGDDDAQGELQSTNDPWLKIATDAGARPFAQSKAIVIGLRGYERGSGLHDTRAQKTFDDTFVVLRRNGSTLAFAGSTHPFETEGTSGVPDVDHDGASDVGMVRPGAYRVTPLDKVIDEAPVFWVKNLGGNDKLPAWRDTNHDGVVSDDERAASAQRKDTIDSILFHVGSDAAPKAVGCQVSTRDVLRALAAAAPEGFDYVLIDAKTLSAIPSLP